jgi:hypothetical protein
VLRLELQSEQALVPLKTIKKLAALLDNGLTKSA